MTQLVSTRSELRAAISAARLAGKSIGLVPTMGALHEGHLSLVDASRADCDLTVVTVFVNPTQFGPNEDLKKYPRNLDNDLAVLRARGADVVFAPSVSEMYAADHTTFVDVGEMGQRLEGEFRPTHFRGVATIVLKLFNLIPADHAYFGQKDFQQTLVIKKMVADLDLPIEIRVCPTVRESGGLAMSSRNQYLSAEDRQRALAICGSLRLATERIQQGERKAETIVASVKAELAAAGISVIDYVALTDPNTLENVFTITGPTLVAIAARVGATRLIDNEVIGA